MEETIVGEGCTPAIALIAPPHLLPAEAQAQLIDTPYGPAIARRGALGASAALWLDADGSPLAAVYAAKDAGAARVVELVPARACNRLLDPGDLVLPDDLVDRTELGRYTFFASKGYGFLPQREPFCPDLRAALLAAARQHTPRAFARAVYLAGPAAQAAAWGCDLAGDGVVPASYLARELELCYAALAIIGPDTEHEEPGHPAVDTAQNALLAQESGARSQEPGEPRLWDKENPHQHGSTLLQNVTAWLPSALGHLPAERACPCAHAMQQYRDRGDIGPDWRTWLG